MATSSVVLSVTTNGEQPQGGAATGPTTSYRLETLEQPRFFYGQLLTDQDLNALLAWAQGQLRLARHRQGWGVVCGLDLRCDPQKDGRVIVGPGYAVSACGDSIVVPAASKPYDLARACVEQPVDCAEVRRPIPDEQRRKVQIGSYAYYEDDLRYIDLYLRYVEEGASPQTALGRRVSGQTEVCEHSRMREGYDFAYAVTCKVEPPMPPPEQKWHEGYSKIWAELSRLADAQPGARVSELQKVIGTQSPSPLRYFPLIGDLVAGASEAKKGMGDADFFLVLFYLIQDRHNAYIADTTACADVTGDPGVPLGRLRVQVHSEGGVRRCHILDIDAAPPYRRLFGPDTLPAPHGQVNLGQLIWRRADEARALLADLGISAEFVQSRIPAKKNDLVDLFTCAGVTQPLFAAADDEVIVRTVAIDYLGERVVAVCRTAAVSDTKESSGEPLPEEAAPPEPELEAPPPSAPPSSQRRRRS